MPEEELTISAVIPHLNQPEALARCLDSLFAGRRSPDEVVVVDNGSSELPRAVCGAHPCVRFFLEPESGPGLARNRGIAESGGAILAFIDADCRAGPGWLETIEAVFATNPGARILGGDVRIAHRDPARPTMLEAYESVYAYRMDRYIAREAFTGTGNLAVRREVLDAVGPFAGLEVAEDRDWGQRATRAGFDLRYVPEMRVYHPARESFADLARKWDRHTAHDWAARAGTSGRRLRWGLRTLAMLVSPAAETLRIARSDRLAGIRARTLAWAGLARIRLYRARIMASLLFGADPGALTKRWRGE